MNKNNKFKKLIVHLISAIRPLLGPRNVCVHTVSCSNYAKYLLQNRSFFIAIPLILLRLLSCNPLTAIFFKFKYRRYKKPKI